MNIKVIVNGYEGGMDRRIELVLSRRLSPHLKDLEHTLYKGHARKIASDAISKGCDTLVVCGGDGTVHEVVNSIAGRNIRLGIIPAGTANDLARQYAIPANIDDCCDMIKDSLIRGVDLIECNGQYVTTSVGMGLPSLTIEFADMIKQSMFYQYCLPKTVRSKKYYFGLIPAMLHYAGNSITAQIISDCDTNIVHCKSLIVSNVSTLGRSFHVNPNNSADNDNLRMYLIEKTNTALDFIKAVLATQHGKQEQHNGVRYLNGKSFTIKMNFPVTVFGDGEIIDKTSEITLRKLQQGLPLIVPAAMADKNPINIIDRAYYSQNELSRKKISVAV